MKIKYNKPANPFKYMRDSKIVFTNKKNILKTKKYPFHNSFKENLWYFIWCMIILIVSVVFYIVTKENSIKFFPYGFSIFCFFTGSNLMTDIFIYLRSRNKDLSGTISINNDGIEDDSNGIKICIKWDAISCIIIGKLSFNIFLKEQDNYLCLPIDIKDDLLKVIREYSDAEIIDLSSLSFKLHMEGE